MLHIVLSHLNLSLSLKKKKKENEKKKLGLVFPTFTSPSFPCLCFISGLILHGGHPISFTHKKHVSEVHKCNAQQSASISLFFSFFLFFAITIFHLPKCIYGSQVYLYNSDCLLHIFS